MAEHRCRANAGGESRCDRETSEAYTAGNAAVSSRVAFVEDSQSLQGMVSHLLDKHRTQPAVGLTVAGEEESLVLSSEAVRAVVGATPRIFVVRGELWLQLLADVLGPLQLPPEMARIWWPDLVVGGDVRAHPVITPLEDEPESMTLGEFALVFQLSHPVVRRELDKRDELLALAEYQVTQLRKLVVSAEERTRDAHRERHREALRAEQAKHAHDGRTKDNPPDAA
jgi:hypothetical protein